MKLHIPRQSSDLAISRLYNERTFYRAFEYGLKRCKHEAIIESPFITLRRVDGLLPIIGLLRQRGVVLVINTKPLEEHDAATQPQAREALAKLQKIGVKVLVTGGHHRKLAIIDQKILYEGSLNILSQNDSCEVMRRIESRGLAQQMVSFLALNDYL